MAPEVNFSPELTLPFTGAANTGISIIRLAADTVRVPLRRNIGLDLLSKSRLAAGTGMMLLVSAVGSVHVGFSLFSGLGVRFDDDTSLRNYALVVYLGGGIWQRISRLREEKLGTDPHTFWPGDGWFYSFIPLPCKYIDLLVEPFVTFLVGAVCRYRLGWGLLGLWLMAGALALFVSEKMFQAEMMKLIRAHKNLGKEAKWMAEYERNRPKGSVTKEGASSVSVPTGNDENLEALIEKNKRDNAFLN